jgi:hypothetical protein
VIPVTPNIRLCIRDLGEVVRFSFRPLGADEPEQLLASVRKSALEFEREKNPLFDELKDSFTKFTRLVVSEASGVPFDEITVATWPGDDGKAPQG